MSCRPKSFCLIKLKDYWIINIFESNASVYLIFLHEDIHQGKVENTTFGWVCLGMSRNDQAFLNLSGVFVRVVLGAVPDRN